MKMKKLISILAAGTMTMGLLAGCGSSSESTEEDTSGQAAQEDSADEGSTDAAASDEAETSGSGNVLIAYYSATGNTEAVANMIADATGGDLFELEPTEPYTDDDLNCQTITAVFPRNMKMKTKGTWNWFQQHRKTGILMILYLSVIRSGGASPHGR